MTPYKQVLHFQATGQWPDGTPQWAKDVAEEYHCAPEDERVQLWALQKEIHRLHDVIVCVAASAIPNATLLKMMEGEKL